MESLKGGRKQSSDNMLEAKTEELVQIREELKRAKEGAMQSYLDSRPLIDELEKLQSGLEGAKKQSSMSSQAISELESELETTITSIKRKKEEELMATKMVNEISLVLDQTRQEMESLKRESEKGRRARSKLKQVLRIRRQTLRTLQLTLRAVRIESEAFGASAAKANYHINCAEQDNTTVRLTLEDYHALTRREKEETSLADWRVSVSIEQRLAAEASRKLASTRLKQIYSENRIRKSMEHERVSEYRGTEVEEAQDPGIRGGMQFDKRGTAFPKESPNIVAGSTRENKQISRRVKGNRHKMLLKKKKPSILRKIRSFLVRKLTRFFK